MSDQEKRIQEIRERANAATQAPWRLDKEIHAHLRHEGTGWPIASFYDEHFRGEQWEKDAAFIANARQDIPYLLDLIESLQRERQEPEPQQSLQQRFALACRILADGSGLCPQNIFETGWEECDGEADECGDRDMWKCWQKFINETVEVERVCRVCGCTENNACFGRDDAQECCSWIEEDLCSACGTDPEGEKKNET